MCLPCSGTRIVFLLFVLSVLAGAQSGAPPATTTPSITAEGEDSDPTRPVVWSLREEYYNLPGEAWANVFIFRKDRAFLQNHPRLTGKRGILTRFDLPISIAAGPFATRVGLGDIYAQALWVPSFRKKSAFFIGSGISLPTASDMRLGTGKLVIAPVAGPVWFIPQRGLAFLKVQDYVSVAGDSDRRNLHYLAVTPLLLWRLKGKPYWIQLDGETKTNWQADGHTGYKAGFLLGRMTHRRYGVWIKAEVGFGPYREATFAMKTSLFKVR